VTVMAPTAALADALSTAFYLLGPEAAAPYVAQHPEVGVVFVEKRPEHPSACLLAFGLDEHDFVVAGNTVH
jgi:thiamine biosynthesis lipoprotein